MHFLFNKPRLPWSEVLEEFFDMKRLFPVGNQDILFGTYKERDVVAKLHSNPGISYEFTVSQERSNACKSKDFIKFFQKRYPLLGVGIPCLIQFRCKKRNGNMFGDAPAENKVVDVLVPIFPIR
jgi:hypothetical protein